MSLIKPFWVLTVHLSSFKDSNMPGYSPVNIPNNMVYQKIIKRLRTS
jgi:hypothetical protein